MTRIPPLLPLLRFPPTGYTRSALRIGAVAQLGERLVRNEEVAGSIPVGSTFGPRWRTHPLWLLTVPVLMPAVSLAGVLLTSLLIGQSLGQRFDGVCFSETLKHSGLTLFGACAVGRAAR